jgi:hypothetical protein
LTTSSHKPSLSHFGDKGIIFSFYDLQGNSKQNFFKDALNWRFSSVKCFLSSVQKMQPNSKRAKKTLGVLDSQKEAMDKLLISSASLQKKKKTNITWRCQGSQVPYKGFF